MASCSRAGTYCTSYFHAVMHRMHRCIQAYSTEPMGLLWTCGLVLGSVDEWRERGGICDNVYLFVVFAQSPQIASDCLSFAPSPLVSSSLHRLTSNKSRVTIPPCSSHSATIDIPSQHQSITTKETSQRKHKKWVAAQVATMMMTPSQTLEACSPFDVPGTDPQCGLQSHANETFSLHCMLTNNSYNSYSSQDASIETIQMDQLYSTDEISTGKGAGRVLGYLTQLWGKELAHSLVHACSLFAHPVPFSFCLLCSSNPHSPGRGRGRADGQGEEEARWAKKLVANPSHLQFLSSRTKQNRAGRRSGKC